MNELELAGLDGGNPLAFLAALGTLRTLSETWKDCDVRMSWRHDVAWRPVLHSDKPLTPGAVVDALNQGLKTELHERVFSLAKDLNMPADEFRAFAERAAREAGLVQRLEADFVAAFACDVCTEREGKVQDTALRTMSGAGHQHFLEFMRQLSTGTEPAHLMNALFSRWVYADPGPSMRWDPEDDRRYALRWGDPSKDAVRTVRGANRLAVEGLSLLSTAPTGVRLATTGFRGRGRADTAWTWPIWAPPIGVRTVRSLLAWRGLQENAPPRRTLVAMGVVEVFRSRRITQGNYRNFTPAQAV